MSIFREDVGSECNTARRKFWELCASSYEPTLDFESSCKRASEWADQMLIEWDKRWIVENPSFRCEGCGEWFTEREIGNDTHHTRSIRNEKGKLEPEMCGPVRRVVDDYQVEEVLP